MSNELIYDNPDGEIRIEVTEDCLNLIIEHGGYEQYPSLSLPMAEWLLENLPNVIDRLKNKLFTHRREILQSRIDVLQKQLQELS